MAVENGINYIDLASGDSVPFASFGQALKGMRDKVYYHIYFGADYQTGQYGWTLDLEEIKRSIDWQLKALRTDYIDFGFIHCMDEMTDLEQYRSNGVLDYLLSLQKQGVVRHIGLSSHTPEVVQQVLDWNLIDMLMFSINPAYDYQHGEFANGSAAQRMALYQRCEAEGVGISVMKAFSGGQLLNAKTSPFRKALTEYQCLAYALDKPGVLTVLPGILQPPGSEAAVGLFGCRSGRKRLLYPGHLHSPGSGGNLCLLQPLPALPRRVGRRADQQVLRPGQSRGYVGSRSLSKLKRPRFRLHPVRTL